jgi:broad specificity phosphatase PhoE
VIVLVRHGETEWSLSGQHTSRTDLSLTPAGRERAAALAPMFASRTFALVLSSPLLRARETCELAGLSAAAELCDDLREWDYGAYEGLTTPQIRERDPDWVMWRDGCPDGESPAQVGARADRVIERLRSADADADADADAIAFAHGHILRVLAARWIEQPPAGGARLALDPGAVCELGYARETSVILRWNLTPQANAGGG